MMSDILRRHIWIDHDGGHAERKDKYVKNHVGMYGSSYVHTLSTSGYRDNSKDWGIDLVVKEQKKDRVDADMIQYMCDWRKDISFVTKDVLRPAVIST